MRSHVRLFLIVITVVLVAVFATETRQNAVSKISTADEGDPLCVGSLSGTGFNGTQLVLEKIPLNGALLNTRVLPWDSLSRPKATRLVGASLQRPLVFGFPEDDATAPARSILAPAQTIDVAVDNNFFSPATITIAAGDTVRWTWIGSMHSVTGGACCEADGTFCSTSDFDCDNAGASFAGAVYSHSFNTPGVYDYFCNVHLGAMTGLITVNEAPAQSTVQFSASSASVAETPNTTTKVDMTVARSGDTSGACSIDYASADATASERSDHVAAIGRLQFAAGETSKTITAFIVDDAFGESAETFTVSLSNPVGCTLGSTATFTVTINSDESVNGANPVKDASFITDFFVRQHYVDFFSREADASGLAFWKNQIDECVTQGCREVRRINVSAAFFLSIEFQETGYLVYKANQAAFNSAETLRLRNFLADTQEIGRGVVVGAPNWEQQIDANKQKFFLDFVQRTNFLDPANFPNTLTAAQFVDKLNANTFDPLHPGSGGALTQSQRDALVSQLSANPSSPSLRAQVLRSVSQNALFNQRQFNKAFVLMQYFGYLRRNPNDLPDMNFDGYNFWLGKLNEFNGNYITAEMVKAFITSTEYQGRFGP